MIPSDIDSERFKEEWTADLDVLRSLAENGDKAEIRRIVDVSFLGSSDALDLVTAEALELGFVVQNQTVADDGRDYLFLERVQTTEVDAVRDMRFVAMRFEDRYDVECDGWGCVAQDGLPD